MVYSNSRLLFAAAPRDGTAIIRPEILRGTFDGRECRPISAKVELPPPDGFPAPVLLCGDDGIALEVLGGAWPVLARLDVPPPPRIVAPQRPPSLRYDAAEREALQALRRLLRHAISAGDPDLLGEVATASARMQQRHLPVPGFDLLLNALASFGACGLAVAYGGAGAALIFDAARQDCVWRMHCARRALQELGMGAGDARPAARLRLEQFPVKGTPVERKKLRPNRRPEPQSDSIGPEKALGSG